MADEGRSIHQSRGSVAREQHRCGAKVRESEEALVVSVPGAFKLDHLQPFKPILF